VKSNALKCLVLLLFFGLVEQSIAQLLPIKGSPRERSLYVPLDSAETEKIKSANPNLPKLFKKKKIESVRSGWWPLQEGSDISVSYKTSALPLVSLSADGKDRFSIYTEIVSDNFSMLGTLIRVSLGTLVASGEDGPAESRQRLFSGGGNAILQFSTDIAYLGSSENSNLRFTLTPRLSGDLPAASSTTEISGNIDLGVEAYGFLYTISKKFKFFLNSRFGFVFGSDNFEENIQVDGPFLLWRLSMGFDVEDAFRVTATGPLAGNEILLNNIPWQVSVAILTGD